VFDLIYNPHRTRLLQDAQARGLYAANGLLMLVAQAARAKELFTGEPVSDEKIRAVCARIRREKLNAVLIGMPGSGKTGIGCALAKKMGREFVDIDERIVAQAGMPIPEIFEKYGEAKFRALEREVIAQHGKRRQLVIATGGGAPLFDENVRALSQNGAILRVHRDVKYLATDGRPLSKDLEQLAAAREPRYRAVAARAILNDGTIERAARDAQEGFYAIAGD
jgi:shikimate dehydrogenase